MAMLPAGVASSLSPLSLHTFCCTRGNDENKYISTSIRRQSHASRRIRPLHRLAIAAASSSQTASPSASSSSSSLAGREPMLPPYNVLITGSTKGIGYALAKEFLKAGDNVIICSRSVSIFIDMDETGGRSNEWIYK